mgnify:CR=1 FL=1
MTKEKRPIKQPKESLGWFRVTYLIASEQNPIFPTKPRKIIFQAHGLKGALNKLGHNKELRRAWKENEIVNPSIEQGVMKKIRVGQQIEKIFTAKTIIPLKLIDEKQGGEDGEKK